MNLLIYSAHFKPRLAYICQQVLQYRMGLNVEWTNNPSQYRHYKGAKINYGKVHLQEKEIFIPDSNFLAETKIVNQPFMPFYYNKIPTLFLSKQTNATFPFDLFATLFFHLSRYEEYLPFQPDDHGRFPASESWAFQNDCLQKPVVDILINTLKHQLLSRFPFLSLKKQAFKFLPTIDVDMPWAFAYKGWKRALGGFLQDCLKGNPKFLKSRIKTTLGLQRDPFFTFDRLDKWARKYHLSPVYFILIADHSKYDKNPSPKAPAFKKLIRHIAQKHQTGLHPSYFSDTQKDRLLLEKNRLESIAQKDISLSRQHFLKIHLPQTYQQLITAGITTDFTMGYATDTGFRAGTSLPFYWYDLANERTTNLLVQPFQAMDVTLKNYLKLNPATAKRRLSELVRTTAEVNGTFCSIWHNSSFSSIDNWNEWESVYLHLIEECVLASRI